MAKEYVFNPIEGVFDVVDTVSNSISALEYNIVGPVDVIETGIQIPGIEVPFDCEIQAVTLLADQTGSIQVDIWKDAYANYPPDNADSITASAVPAISAGVKAQDFTLTGWAKTLSAGDILRFNVDSIDTIESCLISLKVKKV